MQKVLKAFRLKDSESIWKHWTANRASERVLKWEWKLLCRVWFFAAPWTVVHRILQARILEWVAIPFSRGSSQPRDRTQVSHIASRLFTSQATINKLKAKSPRKWHYDQITNTYMLICIKIPRNTRLCKSSSKWQFIKIEAQVFLMSKDFKR